MNPETRKHYENCVRQWEAEKARLSKEWDEHISGSGARMDICGKISIFSQLINDTKKELERHGPYCSQCCNEIDPEVCCCGDYIKSHGFTSGHNPIPMGCTCGYYNQNEIEKPL